MALPRAAHGAEAQPVRARHGAGVASWLLCGAAPVPPPPSPAIQRATAAVSTGQAPPEPVLPVRTLRLLALPAVAAPSSLSRTEPAFPPRQGKAAEGLGPLRREPASRSYAGRRTSRR
ncbi:uncharacterized protein LOC133268521 isoform X2 [Pezoporus flaviventris]|uniref:uncharacterized protein LOC133268521 isoform X2 n=1 Tax=Pezoporus flaviventris TaxID=889875 RepID=UPI002AB27BA6|nr:uncharacterized protein LOC133268521 isoform X2 [Pezoporus flaviventris]